MILRNDTRRTRSMVESGRSTDKPIKLVYFPFWRMRWGSGTPQKSLHCTKCRCPSAHRRGGRKGQQTSGFSVAARLTDSPPTHTHPSPNATASKCKGAAVLPQSAAVEYFQGQTQGEIAARAHPGRCLPTFLH